MFLLFADQVNIVESLGSDQMRGQIPNLVDEMGGMAEFKCNRDAAV